MSRRLQQYDAEGITVTFELKRCIHAAECVRSLPQVFDPQRRPWVELERADNDAIADVVSRCPTGALKFERSAVPREPRGESTEPKNSVQVRPRGPLFVSGDLELRTGDGGEARETRVALCRCGASANKPFCDNRHRDVAFADDGALGENRLKSEDGDSPTLRLTVVPNGPILVSGPLEIVGAASELQRGEKGALCRCGASAVKPYCDGSHKAVGFEAE